MSIMVPVLLWFWALMLGLAVIGSFQIGYWIVTLLLDRRSPCPPI